PPIQSDHFRRTSRTKKPVPAAWIDRQAGKLSSDLRVELGSWHRSLTLAFGGLTFMTHIDPKRQKTKRRARASFVLAIVALAVGVVCMMCERWPAGLIFVFAGVAGTMAAWQLRDT